MVVLKSPAIQVAWRDAGEYFRFDSTIQALHTRGCSTGLWTEKGLDRIAHEAGAPGSRVMTLDVRAMVHITIKPQALSSGFVVKVGS
jgi:hypothetical protein